jgi:S-adenosylmethionine:tRNA ribosyltransferase-isomerase
MKVSDFSFEIPEHLVAQAPPADRESSLLMTVDREPGRIDTGAFTDFPTMIEPGTQMVLNDSRVVKCRLRGVSATTGGKADFLLLSEEEPALWRALCRRLKAGRRYLFSDKLEGRVVGQRGTATLIRFNRRIDDTYLRKFGRVPLPPYIKREATSSDEERYQTVYAREPGSIAAPTAGLHFTQRVLGEIAGRGVGIVFITLHVGEGTFLPLRTNRVESHRMAEEGYHLSEEAAARLQTAREKGNKILAVGTTVLSTRATGSRWWINFSQISIPLAPAFFSWPRHLPVASSSERPMQQPYGRVSECSPTAMPCLSGRKLHPVSTCRIAGRRIAGRRIAGRPLGSRGRPSIGAFIHGFEGPPDLLQPKKVLPDNVGVIEVACPYPVAIVFPDG